MEKDYLSKQLKRLLKIYKINEILKLWARVPIAVSSCPDSDDMYRRTLWTIDNFLVSSSREN